MYTLLISEDNSISTTKKERIMQRSSMVDSFQILVYPTYKECDMTDFTVQMEYVLPASKRYVTEILELSEDMYEDHLRYVLPFGTKLTAEPGEIELQLTFARAELDENGRSIQRVRKTSTAKITIVPIAAWSDIIPDEALSAIDQRLIKTDAQIRALEDYAIALGESQVDNLSYDDAANTLQLLAGENAVGDKVKLKSGDGSYDEDGVPVVDLDGTQSGGSSSGGSEEYYSDVIEF